MPDYTNEPAFQTILKSKKFGEFPAEKRQAIINALGELTPEERAEFAAGIQEQDFGAYKPTSEEIGTRVDEMLAPAKLTGKQALAMGIGTVVGGGIGALGAKGASMLASRAASSPTGAGFIAKATEKALPTVSELFGNYLGEQTNKAVGLTEGTPFGSPTQGDVLSVAVPGFVRGAQAVGRGITKPAQKAITEANETNMALDKQYQGDIGKVDTAIQRKVGQLDEAAAETNLKNQTTYDASVQAWRDKNQQMIRDYRQKLTEITNDASLKQADKLAAEATETAAFQKRMQDHNTAFRTSPAEGTKGFTMWDYNQSYREAADYANLANPVDVSSFRDAAMDVGIDLKQPAQGIQSPFVRIADALRGFGQVQAQPTAPGQPPGPPTFEPVPLNRLIETQKKLGQIIGKSKGDERYAAKQLWQAADDAIDEAAKVDPDARLAQEASQDARLGFKRAMAKKDWEEMWRTYSSPDPAGNREMRTGSLVKYYQDKYKQDRFNQQAWSPQEWKQMDAVVARTPTERVGKPPTIKPDILPDYSKAKRPTADPMPQPEPEVYPDYEGANYPDYPEPPVPVKPDVGNFPLSYGIMAKSLGAGAGGALAGGAIGGQPELYLAGAAAGLAAVGLPHYVSKYMLTRPGGKQIVENIMQGKKTVGPLERTMFASIAKKMGIPTDEE